MKHYIRYTDYLIELNILLLIFAFPLNLAWFNRFWESLIVIWIVKKIVNKERIVIPPTAPLLLTLIGAIVISSILSEKFFVSYDKIKYFIKGVGLCMVSYDFLNGSEGRISRVMNYFIVCTLLVALYAIYVAVFINGLASRAQSFFGNTFYLALWAGIGLLIAIARLFKESSKVEAFIYYVSVLILGTAFLLSKTRGPVIAFGIILLLVALYAQNKRKLLGLFASLGVIAIVLFFIDHSLQIRVLSILDDKTDLRWSIWAQSFVMIKEKFTAVDWLFGRGPGMYKFEYPQFDHANSNYGFPHLIPLELLYTSGLIGVLSLIGWLAIFYYKLASLLKNSKLDLYVKYQGLLPLLILLICFFNESFFSRYFSFPFWFFVGMALSLLNLEKLAQREYEESHLMVKNDNSIISFGVPR